MVKAIALLALLVACGWAASPFDSLEVQADWSIWQNFMPIVPPAGPPVHLSLHLTVVNKSSGEVFFRVESLKLFLAGSQKIWWRPKLKTSNGEKLRVAPGDTLELELVPDEATLFAKGGVAGKGAHGELILQIGKNMRKFPLAPKTIEAVH